MKFRSLNELAADARATVLRFPLALAFAAIGTLGAIIYSNFPYDQTKHLGKLVNLIMISSLGITSFLSLKVYAETHRWSRQKEMLADLFAVLALAIYYYILPLQLKYFDLNRFGLISANLHLLVAIAPFLFLSRCTNAFWQYNKALFLRFIIAFIYSNTIYIGITIAIGVTDQLFEFIKFDGKIYGQLWFIVVGIFNTWFFLKGVPVNIVDLERDESYPKGLRVFTQFVLIPLTVLYILILYMYMGKIIATWSLPRGWLSSFILGVSILGIVTLLLVHPLRTNKEFGWVRAYSRYFYLALFPLIVMMALAVGRRIADYGVTEQRYFVLVFTLWLLVLALRFTFRPNTDIRSIPLTLFILVAAATWGPWSAMAVAKANQTARLEKLLVVQGLLKNGRISKTEQDVPVKASNEISNIVAYLASSYGLRHLEKWAPPDLSVNWKDITPDHFVNKFLGLEYTGYYSRDYYRGYSVQNIYYSMTMKNETVSKISGYDYFARFNMYGLNTNSPAQAQGQGFATDKGEVRIFYDRSTAQVKARYLDEEVVLASLSDEWLKGMREKHGLNSYNLEADQLTFSAKGGRLRAKLEITSMNGQIPQGDNDYSGVSQISGNLLFTVE